MRILFIATGDIALPTFRHLLERGPRPLALLTQPDKPVGRRQIITPPAVKREALAAGLPVLQPRKVGEALPDIAAWAPEVTVVMAYGQILPQPLLNLPALATINLHASLLPRHRGASCIQAAIAAGDAESGVSSMHIAPELDSGDVILTRGLPIRPDETGGSLHDRLADLAPAVLAETLARLADGSAPRIPQDPAVASYAPKLHRHAGRIDWSRPAAEIERLIRAYHPWPGTHTMAEENGALRRLKIFPHTEPVPLEMKAGELRPEGDALLIGCGCGALRVRQVQADGSRRMEAGEFLRGRALTKVG